MRNYQVRSLRDNEERLDKVIMDEEEPHEWGSFFGRLLTTWSVP